MLRKGDKKNQMDEKKADPIDLCYKFQSQSPVKR